MSSQGTWSLMPNGTRQWLPAVPRPGAAASTGSGSSYAAPPAQSTRGVGVRKGGRTRRARKHKKTRRHRR